MKTRAILKSDGMTVKIGWAEPNHDPKYRDGLYTFEVEAEVQMEWPALTAIVPSGAPIGWPISGSGSIHAITPEQETALMAADTTNAPSEYDEAEFERGRAWVNDPAYGYAE